MEAVLGIGYWPATGAIAAAVGTLLLMGYVYRHRTKPSARWFMVALGTQVLWCLSYGIGLFVADPTLRWYFEIASWVGMIWTGPLFLGFSLSYTGRRYTIQTWPLIPFFLVPVVGTVGVITTRTHGLVLSGYEIVTVAGLSVASYSIEPLGFVVVGSGTVAAGIGVAALVGTILDYGPLYRREAAAVALSTVAPSIGLLVWLSGLGPAPALNLAPALFVSHVLLDAYAFVETDMFESDPTTRRTAERTAIEDLPNPVVILDTEGRIVECNDRARALLDANEGLLGTPLESHLHGKSVVDRIARGETDFTVRFGDRNRTFRVSGVPLSDPTGLEVGSTVVFQDVTRSRRREQRLDVLNRVLRHNLRNGMVAVTGHAGFIRDRTADERIETAAETIAESGDSLVAVADKARDFEEVRETAPAFSTVNLSRLAVELIEEVSAEFPERTVRSDVATDTTLRSDPRLLRLTVSNLLENALEHTDESDGRVTVRVEREDRGVVIEVDDDGSGIPEDELAPLRSQRETQLEHGSGIGLWIVHWCGELLGGHTEFDVTGGTTVTVVLPDLEGTDT